MERSEGMGYTMIHETNRNRRAVGAATPTGRPVAEGVQESVGSGAGSGLVREFGLSMVPGLPETGAERAGSPSHARSTFQADGRRQAAVGAATPEGAPGVGLPHGPLDPEAGLQGDRYPLRRRL